MHAVARSISACVAQTTSAVAVKASEPGNRYRRFGNGTKPTANPFSKAINYNAKGRVALIGPACGGKSAAEKAGYAVFLSDSLSHFWTGKDGAANKKP